MDRFNFSSQKDVEKITKRIRAAYQKYAKGLGGADDAVQEIITRMLEGQHQHATIDQCVVDYLRTISGRKGLPGYSGRQALERPSSYESKDLDRLLSVDNGGGRVSRVDFDDVSRWIGDKTDRASFILYVQWGLSEAEIGNLFGFSESRVSQRIARVQKCLRQRIKTQESRFCSEKETSLGRLLSEKTAREWWAMGQRSAQDLARSQPGRMASFDEESF